MGGPRPLPEVVAAACRSKVNLLVTHHPLLFTPVQRIDFDTPLGRIIQMAARSDTAIFAAHTNLDSGRDGLNDMLAARIGLRNLSPLQMPAPGSDPGLGRVGELDAAMDVAALARLIKSRLGLPQVRCAGDPALRVRRAALCTGSGSSLMQAFLNSRAEAFISGDLKYHDARTAQAADRALIDVGHFASEHLVVGVLADRLQAACRQAGLAVRVTGCDMERDPFWAG